MGKRRRYSIRLMFDNTLDSASLKVVSPLCKMEEEVSVCLCELDAQGKKDHLKPLVHDVTNGFMKMVTDFMCKVIDRRIRPYDSTKLIVKLIDKMSPDQLMKLSNDVKILKK